MILRTLINGTNMMFEVRAFAHWWWEQLRASGLALLRATIPSMRPRVTLALTCEGGQFYTLQRNQMSLLFNFSKRKDGLWPTDLKAFGPVEIVHGARALVGFSGELILSQTFTLPDIVEHDLNSTIKLRMEREFPLNLESISIAYEVTSHLRQQRQIVVTVWVLKRDILEQVIKMCGIFGIRPVQIGVRTANGSVTSNFLKPEEIRGRLRFSWLARPLTISICMLLLTAMVTISALWGWERYRTNQVLESVRPKAQSVQHIAQSLARQAAPARLLAQISEIPDAADVVLALTDRTPSDTWVYQLSVKSTPLVNPRLEISAFTPRSLNYLKSLENSAEFEQVRLISSEDDPGQSTMRRAKLSAVASRRAPTEAVAESH